MRKRFRIAVEKRKVPYEGRVAQMTPKELEDDRFIAEALEGFHLYSERVGRTGQERLRWALSIVDKPGGWRAFTPGDRLNLRLELLTFMGLGIGLDMRRLEAGEEPIGAHGRIVPPTEAEVGQILEMFDKLLVAAIRREDIVLDPSPAKRTLQWLEQDGHYGVRTDHIEKAGWIYYARKELVDAIGESGHLLKICPAPAKRGKEGETCNTRFVARRPNQAYCSARCQTRAASRAYRSGDSTPVAKMLAAAGELLGNFRKDRAGSKSQKEG